ncbi:MAG: translation initiation factor IF-2 [Clostridia bacterium]|nr:translation initiation factor IF-2 [Clostridia bacterium]
MEKVKVYDIAKKLNVTSKDILQKAEELRIEAKSHLSSIDESDAKRIEESLKKSSNNKKDNKESTPKKEKNETPVIIRREVIISEEENKKKEEEQKRHTEEKRKNSVGFVERKQNDYNIVYRNKPSKPMTLNELFGINKAEEKKEDIKEEEKKEEKLEQTQEKKEEKEEIKIKEEVSKVSMQNTTTEIKEKQENKEKNNKVENQLHKKDNQNYRNNNQNKSGYNYQNRENQNNYKNNSNGQNNYRSNNQNNYRNNNQNGQNNNYRNNNQNNSYRNNNNYRNNNQNGQNNYRNNNQNRNNFGGNNRFGQKPLDEKGIEKNIKNIMADMGEKEVVREYNKSIDKQKENNKFEENKTTKKNTKTRKNNNGEINEHKLKGLKRTDQLSNMFEDQDGGMLEYYDLSTQRGKKGKKKNKSIEEEPRNKQKIFQLTEITIPESITVKDLATELKKTTSDIIKKLLGYGIMATINNEVDFDTAFLIAEEFNVKAIKKQTVTEEDILFDDSEDKEEDLKTRPPVVVVMGHVDHGKTSLLDAVKKTNIISGEAGGITQHIGAYKVKINDREITFLDTPGHEAFTAMRARGAQITDIAILVVAANDGVMPQTVEAINHAKSAGIPIIVAINKIDLPDANIDKVKQELMTYELVPEEWGGDTIYVPISAKNNINIDQLLEMVILQADVLELKANPNKQSKGVVIEARLDKNKGPIATMLVQRGTLDIGDEIVVGSSIGRIRVMTDDKGKKVKKAGPSTPVEILGLTEVPQAGDTFYEVDDEKTAKHLIERRKRQAREIAINANTKVTLNDLFSQIEKGDLKVLNLIVKADVQGSVEAIKQSLEKLSNEEVSVKVIHSAVGAVTESDVTLAKVSKAIIIAFNVRPVVTAKDMAEKEEVEIKQYSVIYQAIDDVEAAMKGMLAPKYIEKVIGTAEVRQIFKISNVGTVAGAYVLTGKVERNAGVRIIRDNVVIHDGKLATLKRFKDEAKEVTKGFECGIQIEDYNDIKEGDIIEAFIMEEVKR